MRLRVGEVARRAGVSGDTVRRWIARGQIESVRLPGGEYRIEEADLERLLAPKHAQAVSE